MATIDSKKLNQDLIQIIHKKNELSELDYNDENYDDVEEELHDLEDDFIESFGDHLEMALQKVHDEVCPDNDVLLPIAYLAKKYYVKEKEGRLLFAPMPGEGVIVDTDKYPNRDTRIVIVPDPVRIIMITDKAKIDELWRDS